MERAKRTKFKEQLVDTRKCKSTRSMVRGMAIGLNIQTLTTKITPQQVKRSISTKVKPGTRSMRCSKEVYAHNTAF